MSLPNGAKPRHIDADMEGVNRQSRVEELVEANREVVRFLIMEGLPCVICGEPFWGTLEELAQQKRWDDARIDQLVEKMKGL